MMIFLTYHSIIP